MHTSKHKYIKIQFPHSNTQSHNHVLYHTIKFLLTDKMFCFFLPIHWKADTPIEEFTPTPAFPALQYLESVDEGGVAWEAGLRTGDFLIEVRHFSKICLFSNAEINSKSNVSFSWSFQLHFHYISILKHMRLSHGVFDVKIAADFFLAETVDSAYIFCQVIKFARMPPRFGVHCTYRSHK